MAYTPEPWIHQFDGVLDGPSPYSYGNEPPAGWVPFPTSKWCTAIPASPTVAADSSDVVTWLLTLNTGKPVDRYIGVGGTVEDYDHPSYYVQATDPVLRLKLQVGAMDPSIVHTAASLVTGKRLRASDLANRLVRRPTVAVPAGGTDAHMVLVSASYSYETWLTDIFAPGEGRFGCKYGAVFDLSGDSTSTCGHAATAAGVSLMAGRIRLVDLQAGHIPHALAIITKYVRNGVFTAPANGAATEDPGVVAGDVNDLKRPVTGSRLQLNYTSGEIVALGLPAWKTTILQAMREYGCIIMDTGGSAWGIQFESSAVDIAYGQPDRWRTWAAANGLALSGGAGSPYIVPLSAGVDWTKLRVVVV